MSNIDIKKAVTDNAIATFQYYRDGQLWYMTAFNELFPVPVADIGTATFNKTEKAIHLMRYMRKWNDSLK